MTKRSAIFNSQTSKGDGWDDGELPVFQSFILSLLAARERCSMKKGSLVCLGYIQMKQGYQGVEPKIVVFPPQIIHFYRVFHYVCLGYIGDEILPTYVGILS